MPHQDPVDTSSLFSLSEIRERMKEKKNGTLKTTKMNASLAAKIRTKAINNSSIIKVTLKQNNKALALALNATKREVRELTKEKMLLQKEVKLGDFERARLRQKLSAVVNLLVRVHHKHNEYIEELKQYMNSQLHDIVKLSSPSERDSCSLLPFDGRLSTTDITDHQADDYCPVRTAPKAMRIPVVREDDKCENGTSDLASTSQPILPLQLPTTAVGEPLKNVARPSVGEPPSSCLMDEPLANSARNGQPSGEMDDTALALDFGAILGGSPSSIPQSSRSCSLSVLNNNNNLGQHSKITRSYSDQMGLSLGHVTERRKRTTGFSALIRDCSWRELSDNGQLVGLTLPKDMDPSEISQMGELVTLKAQSTVRSSEAESLKKMSFGTKVRDTFTSRSQGNLDNCNRGTVPNTTQPKALGINAMSTEVSAQADHVEKIQPWNSRGQNKGHNSQCFFKTIGPSTIHVVSPYHVQDLALSENGGSNVKHTSQHSDKTGGYEKISGVVPTPRKGKTSIHQEHKNKAQVVEFDPLCQWQSLESVSWLESPPPAFPSSLDDALSVGECRKWFKTIPKVHDSSTIQNTTLLKTIRTSLEKTCFGVKSQATDLEKEDSKPKASRKAHTENVMDLSLESYVVQAAKGQETPARSCTLPKTSAVINKSDGKQVPSGRQEKTTQETPKESSKTTPHLNENKILTDLTNTTQSLCHSTLQEEPLIRRGTRARKPVTYEEPKLNRKLRRGDPFANSDFFSCPIYKTRKKKMTKSEAISKEYHSDPIP